MHLEGRLTRASERRRDHFLLLDVNGPGDTRSGCRSLFSFVKGMFMAVDQAVPLSFSPMERAWLKHALVNQVRAVERSRTKEVPGSEVWDLRGKEAEQLRLLIGRF